MGSHEKLLKNQLYIIEIDLSSAHGCAVDFSFNYNTKMEEEYNNAEVGEENPYEDYMVSLNDSVDTAITLMTGRIKTRLAFLEIAGADKENIEKSKKKWTEDILSFLVDKGSFSKESKESLLEIL